MAEGNQKKYLLLGAQGFLGSAIAEELNNRGLNWVGTTLSATNSKNLIKVDPEDSEILKDISKEYSNVINATGSFKPKDFKENPVDVFNKFWANISIFYNAFSKAQIDSFTQLSSAGTIYGEVVDGVYHTEKSTLKPISLYGKAKLFEDYHYKNMASMVGARYISARVTNPFGNKERTKHGFVDVMLNGALYGTEINCYNDANPSRDFVYAPDMASAIVNLIELEKKGAFNIGSGKSVNIDSIIDFVRNDLGVDLKVKRKFSKPAFDVLNSGVCVDKLVSTVGDVNTVDVFEYIRNSLTK